MSFSLSGNRLPEWWPVFRFFELISLLVSSCGGERYNTGHTVFHIPVEIGKRVELVDYGSPKKMGEVVYAKEMNVLNKPRETALEVIKTSEG